MSDPAAKTTGAQTTGSPLAAAPSARPESLPGAVSPPRAKAAGFGAGRIGAPAQRVGLEAAEDASFGELTSGNLSVRIALTEAEVEAAQKLRYSVFYEEMGAHADPKTALSGRDSDEFDAVADHLLVLDNTKGEGAAGVVGTYRLIRRGAAARLGHFYSASEYDISPLLAVPGEVLELGRSCVHQNYRTRPTLQLLWRGIAAYVFKHQIDVMFGCASLPGTDLEALAPLLSYLHAHHLAPPALRPRAVPGRYKAMDLLPPEQLDVRAVTQELPPLIKGYLRLGGFVGEGAVLDSQFNTTDVCVVVKTELMTDKYYRHYERRLSAGDGAQEPTAESSPEGTRR